MQNVFDIFGHVFIALDSRLKGLERSSNRLNTAFHAQRMVDEGDVQNELGLPFGSEEEANAVFSSDNGLQVLSNFILDTIPWHPTHFPRKLLKLLLTRDYRRQHFWPAER